MVNLSWTSLAVSTFWCSLWQKAPPFPDLLHWGGDVCWLPPYLSLPQRVRGAGRWAQRAGREGGWLSRLSHSPGCCTWGWWAPSLRAGSGEPTERDLPSAGSDQTPSGSTCTDTKQTPRAQVGCSLSSEFGLYSAAEVVTCYSHGGNKANAPLRKDCSNSLFWKSGDQQNISWNSFAHPQPVLTVCFAFSQLGRLALEQPCLALEVPFSLLWLRMIHTLHHQTGPSACPEPGFGSAGPFRALESMAIEFVLKGFKASMSLCHQPGALVSSPPAIACTKLANQITKWKCFLATKSCRHWSLDATSASPSCPDSDPSQDTVLNWVLLLTAPQSSIQNVGEPPLKFRGLLIEWALKLKICNLKKKLKSWKWHK